MHSLSPVEKVLYTDDYKKHVSSAFFNTELESELGETLQKSVMFFKSNDDKNVVMSRIEAARATKPYRHVQSPSCIRSPWDCMVLLG